MPNALHKVALAATDDEISDKVRSLRTAQDVASLLEVPYQTLVWHLYRFLDARKYRTKIIRKRTGGIRELRIPNVGLSILQQKLARALSVIYSPTESVQGFVVGRSIKTHADRHCGRRWVLKVDLSDFFNAINFGRVRGMFMSAPVSARVDAATVLAQICCWNNSIPQGAPTSPIVSNLIARSLDSSLRRLAKRFNCYYSRYADDITFSSNRTEFPAQLAKLVREDASWRTEVGGALNSAVGEAGFALNHSKSRLMRADCRQVVTGLVVNEKANVHRWRIDRVRLQLRAWEKYGLKSAASSWALHRKSQATLAGFDAHVKGQIAFISMIRGADDALVEALWRRYSIVSQTDSGRRSIWTVECFDAGSQGTCFVLEGVGFVTAYHVVAGSAVFHVVNPENSDDKFPAKVTWFDKDADVCVIECATLPSGRQKALRRSSRPCQLGDHVFIRGYPKHDEGHSIFTSRGEVVQMRPFMERPNFLVSFQILGGASGAPVFDHSNQVVGVAVAGSPVAGVNEDNERRVSAIQNVR
jgi:RNA-directed DNA polymerase